MKSHKEIEIIPLEEKDRGVASYLLIYSMLDELRVYINKIDQAGLAIKNGLIVRKFYKAVSDGKLTGLISLSDTRSGFIELEYNDVKKQYGVFRAKKVYNALRDAFSVKGVPENSGYITFPVSSELYDDFVACELLKYILSMKKYDRYYVFIKSADSARRDTLTRFGFHEYAYYDMKKNLTESENKSHYLLMELV